MSKKKKRSNQPQPAPTAAEIRAACREIRSGWGRRERLRRIGRLTADDRAGVFALTIPVIRVADIVGDGREDHEE